MCSFRREGSGDLEIKKVHFKDIGSKVARYTFPTVLRGQKVKFAITVKNNVLTSANLVSKCFKLLHCILLPDVPISNSNGLYNI